MWFTSIFFFFFSTTCYFTISFNSFIVLLLFWVEWIDGERWSMYNNNIWMYSFLFFTIQNYIWKEVFSQSQWKKITNFVWQCKFPFGILINIYITFEQYKLFNPALLSFLLYIVICIFSIVIWSWNSFLFVLVLINYYIFYGRVRACVRVWNDKEILKSIWQLKVLTLFCCCCPLRVFSTLPFVYQFSSYDDTHTHLYFILLLNTPLTFTMKLNEFICCVYSFFFFFFFVSLIKRTSF